MPRSSLRRTMIVLLLLSLLTAPLASAAGRQAQPKAATQAPIELLSRAWSLLTSLWGEEGCNVDPNGRCMHTDTGCTGDPNGRCMHTDTGCNVDPNGRCITSPVQVAPQHRDTGCIGDPNGRCTP
jgi:hypothetical protein